MLLYQVQISIEATTEQEWLQWMKTVHIPDLLATGLLSGHHVWKEQSDSPTPLYYFNYYFPNQAAFDLYQTDHAPRLKAHPVELFAGKFSANRKVFLTA